MKITELIAAVRSNEITVEEAAVVVQKNRMSYVVSYYDPPSIEDCKTLATIREEWQCLDKKQQAKLRIQRAPQPELREKGQLWEPCPNCGSEPIELATGVCADCE